MRRQSNLEIAASNTSCNEALLMRFADGLRLEFRFPNQLLVSKLGVSQWTKTQSAGPISCLEHCATRVLHCAIVTRAAVLMFPLLLHTIISNQMRPQRLRGAWFSRLLRHPARRLSVILSWNPHEGGRQNAANRIH